MLTQDYAKKVFEYKDGKLYWKESRGRVKAGDEAGSPCKGYLITFVDKKRYANHRIIYLIHHGNFPEYIDHIDRDTTNNRIENLRQCTLAQNQHNRKAQQNNKSGIKGVFWNSQYKKWHCTVSIGGKQYFAGRYENLSEAEIAITSLRNKLHKEFANHG
jgi:HNH endonuclease